MATKDSSHLWLECVSRAHRADVVQAANMAIALVRHKSWKGIWLGAVSVFPPNSPALFTGNALNFLYEPHGVGVYAIPQCCSGDMAFQRVDRKQFAKRLNICDWQELWRQRKAAFVLLIWDATLHPVRNTREARYF